MNLSFCPSLLNRKSENSRVRKTPVEVILSKTLISVKYFLPYMSFLSPLYLFPIYFLPHLSYLLGREKIIKNNYKISYPVLDKVKYFL